MKKIIAGLIALLLCFPVYSSAQRKSTSAAKRKTTGTASKRNKPLTGTINGHSWVDLGLPSGLKWATENVEPTLSIIPNDFYAWGEKNGSKKPYSKKNSLTYGKSEAELRSKGIIDASGVLNKEYDVAASEWGTTWRMPTKEEWDELLDNCTCEWTVMFLESGYKITGKNGKYIFLPAEGRKAGERYYRYGEIGFYWSSTIIPGTEKAWRCHFNESEHKVDWHFRYHGLSIRPVTK